MFVCVDSAADESWKVDYTGFPSQIFILYASSIAGRHGGGYRDVETSV